MVTARNYPWEALFPPAPTGLEVLIARKRGHPFLALPTERKLALRSLSLYPGQTWLARLGKRTLAGLLRSGLPVPLERAMLPMAEDDPFIRFLNSLESGPISALTILAGNPFVPGRRFILLTFDRNGAPGHIFKIGTDPEAIRLIRAEQNVLETIGGDIPSVIGLHSVYEAPGRHGLAFRYLGGSPPETDDPEGVGRTLSRWNTNQPPKPLASLPAWRRLMDTLARRTNSATAIPFLSTLGRHEVTPVLFHGDFVPWNIRKTGGGEWVALDWERGELTGIPGWDWFHYVIQTEVLVAKAPPSRVCARLETLLSLPTFQRYARETGIRGVERPLIYAYLKYCVRVWRPEEGIAQRVRQVAALWKERCQDTAGDGNKD